ncbi:MAG: cysteine dioxygenase [Cyanobacteria bacterium P01_H01_bin.153]
MNQATVPEAEISPVKNHPVKLQNLIRQLQRSQHFTSAEIQQLVQAAHLESADLSPWANFEHPVTDSYGCRLVYVDSRWVIKVLSWLPGDVSAIHDCGTAQWGAIQYFGEVAYHRYRLTKKLLRTAAATHYSSGSVQMIAPGLVHQIGNIDSKPVLSLHVYGWSQPQEHLPGSIRIFDLLEGSVQYADGEGFFCLPEEQIQSRRYGVRGDRETTLRHHRQMGDRLRRSLQHQDNPNFAHRLAIIHPLY